MKTKYLVSYYFWKDENISSMKGFGNTYVEPDSTEDIYSIDGIDALREGICNKNDFTGCIILNIIPLNG